MAEHAGARDARPQGRHGGRGAEEHPEWPGMPVILADDCGENQRKKICDKCAFYDVPLMRVESGSMIDAAVGEYNRKAAVIIDQGFAKTIQSYMKG